VEAWCKWGEPVRRLVKIVSWEQLSLNPPEHKESINLGSWNVSGAYIEEMS
jgi:hypothetical protein